MRPALEARGLWVELRHRRRHPDTEGVAPDEHDEDELESVEG